VLQYSSTQKIKHQKKPLLTKSSGGIQVWWQQKPSFMNISSPEGHPVSMQFPWWHFWGERGCSETSQGMLPTTVSTTTPAAVPTLTMQKPAILTGAWWESRSRWGLGPRHDATYSLSHDEDHDLLPCARTSIKFAGQKYSPRGPANLKKRTIKLWVIFVHGVIFIHGGRPLLEPLKKAGILRAVALEKKQSKYGPLKKREGEPYL